ncbi:discoidin domain-containing protein [Streptomyces sp. ICC1]|uniref:discoidin domain-containing protein n=1 Tax=Streptomyces sp. ICC1 TaxID=2099583 RepID=UPI0023B862BD|nr:discoidin domain-containing protein [Streptomyces sp. ICC1]
MSEFEVYAADGGPTTPPTTTPPPPTTPPAGTNLARGKSATDTSHTQGYLAGNVTDGDAGSYWESNNSSFPQSLTVDLGATQTVGRLVLKLPASWGTRTQTLSVLGSTDNAAWSTVKASAAYTFTEGSNTVTVTLPASGVRHLRLTFAGNTGWPAGQLSELEAYTS